MPAAPNNAPLTPRRPGPGLNGDVKQELAKPDGGEFNFAEANEYYKQFVAQPPNLQTSTFHARIDTPK